MPTASTISGRGLSLNSHDCWTEPREQQNFIPWDTTPVRELTHISCTYRLLPPPTQPPPPPPSVIFYSSTSFTLSPPPLTINQSLDFIPSCLETLTSSLATIDSTINSGLARDISSTTSQSDSALELAVAIPTRPASTSNHPPPHSVPTDSTVPSLVPAIRLRSEVEQANSELDLSSPAAPDSAFTRARKRQRTARSASPLSFLFNRSPSIPSQNMGKRTDSSLGLPLSASTNLSVHAGPSSLASTSSESFVATTNGHTNGFTNGKSEIGAVVANGVQKHSPSITKVTPPGTTLYDDSPIDREEFVRLVIQSLRDIGYAQSASTLEAESGYAMESPDVSQFRHFILNGMWAKAEDALERLGVEEEEGLWDAKFLISRQKYLELVEAKRPTSALQVLRNEIAPLNVDPDQLHSLSSLIMCTEPEDLRRRAGWDGASGSSRHQLLDGLHDYIPSAVMIPQRRFSTLLQQAQELQRERCTYHNPPSDARFSLYSDHRCGKSDFPRITTTILEVHTDEVWNLAWSHDGNYLASAGKDKSAIIWRRGTTFSASSHTEWAAKYILRDHDYPVGCLSWSMDDSILLTSSENIIVMWNTRTGSHVRSLEGHKETITSLEWLSDGSGFVSAGLDMKIIIWNLDGKVRDTWDAVSLRFTGVTVSPDQKWLVGVGIEQVPYPSDSQTRDSSMPPNGGPQPPRKQTHRMIVYDMATKLPESSVRLDSELVSMSVKTSTDSQHLLINFSPNEIQLWDVQTLRIICKYKDLKLSRHVIRSCFGGIDGNFVLSGSEDATVYVWHRNSGVLLEALTGHGEGSVNSVAWNPTNERMFASCSDDGTIRIWEAPPHGVYISEPRLDLLHTSSSTTLVEKGKGKPNQRQDGSEGLEDTPRTWFEGHDT